MSVEFSSKELLVAGILLLNVAAIAASLVWAWRGGYLSGLDDRSTNLHPEPPLKETSHG